MTSISIEYDPTVDTAYFQVTGTGIGIDSEEIADGIIVDYDQNDNVIAVELLGVRTINKICRGKSPSLRRGMRLAT
ncbi:MAG: DUF2283 domain-containing protein [Synechocystis sp.]|nr:DUF2283 domain-containing protein [Synechocystis sp.]